MSASQSDVSGAPLMVPASEYDALIDIVRALVDEMTINDPLEAVEFVEDEFGHDVGHWMRRILIAGENARELFPQKEADHA